MSFKGLESKYKDGINSMFCVFYFPRKIIEKKLKQEGNILLSSSPPRCMALEGHL